MNNAQKIAMAILAGDQINFSTSDLQKLYRNFQTCLQTIF